MKQFVTTSILAFGASGMMLMAQSSTPQRPTSREPQTSQGTQSNDSEMVSKIRQAISQDQTASSMAHNVRVTARNGTVTLRGKVNSAEEKDAIVSDAKKVAGEANVKDEITVSKPKS